MKKVIFFIVISVILSCCMQKRCPVVVCQTLDFGIITDDSFFIGVRFVDQIENDRNDQDFIKLWVNDTLVFSDSYYTNYIDSTQENLEDMVFGMRVANFHKDSKGDSIKVRIRAISLDSILFGDKRVIDSTFYYRIDNIPGMTIDDMRRCTECDQGQLRLIDPVKNNGCWQIGATDTLWYDNCL